jgi:hypothetical protein
MSLKAHQISFYKRKCPDCGGRLFRIRFNRQEFIEGSRFRIVPGPRGLACHGCENTWREVDYAEEPQLASVKVSNQRSSPFPPAVGFAGSLPSPMREDNPPDQQDIIACRHCGREFFSLGESAKHLLTVHADTHGGGKLSAEEIDRVCFGPLR